jgi:predicted DCC family thiol-disulfide oxidoreductase YuxK
MTADASPPASESEPAAPAATPIPPVPRWLAFKEAFARTYLTIDPRTLGLGRIVLSLLLLFDLWHRAHGGIELWYSNNGLLPNHTMLWRPPTQWMFSLFFMASYTDEAVFGFVLCGLCYLGLLVGWRTRLMQFLSLIAVMSLHSRVPFLENGGDWTVGELAMWSCFLPLGKRFSIDSLRASLKARRETTAAELNDRSALVGDTTKVISLAVLALSLQLANAYLFNAVHKGGPTWRTGSAVHYVLYQDRMITPIALWMRPHMTLWLSRILSWSALTTEALLPMLLLLPFYKVVTRRIAIVCILGLHAGFQLFINLGCFSLVMMSFTPFLVSTEDWTLASRLARRRDRKLTVFFDAGCGVCFQIARVLARMDRHARLRFVSSADVDPLPKGVTRELMETTIVVVDDGTGAVYTRADAMARIFAALPLGGLWSWPLRLPGLRQLANWGYDLFARRRTAVSIGLGLAACGVPGAPAVAPPPAPEPTPFRLALRRAVSGVREAGVAVLLVVFVSETLMINQAVPKFLKFKQPAWIVTAVAYPRLIQAWSMFASDAPMQDESVAVDAVTVDGRHVDPYSEVSGRYKFPGHDHIPPRLGNDSFFFNYSSRIPFKGEYWTAMQEWILRYPERTGRPEDAIVKYDAWIIEDDSPPPGEMKEKNIRSRIFQSYPPK